MSLVGVCAEGCPDGCHEQCRRHALAHHVAHGDAHARALRREVVEVAGQLDAGGPPGGDVEGRDVGSAGREHAPLHVRRQAKLPLHPLLFALHFEQSGLIDGDGKLLADGLDEAHVGRCEASSFSGVGADDADGSVADDHPGEDCGDEPLAHDGVVELDAVVVSEVFDQDDLAGEREAIEDAIPGEWHRAVEPFVGEADRRREAQVFLVLGESSVVLLGKEDDGAGVQAEHLER